MSSHDISSSSSLSVSNSAVTTTPRNHLCRPHLVPYGPPIETVRTMTEVNRSIVELTESNQMASRYVASSSAVRAASERGGGADTQLNSEMSCQRKLEAIAQCVEHIFANDFKEVKKNLNSANRALLDARARLQLCHCLQRFVRRNQVILNNEQFEYVARLLNDALHNEAAAVEGQQGQGSLAHAVLPLTSAFYRKLNNGTVDQCVYTRLQHHQVWHSMPFWEMSFYADVQRSLRPVYLSNEEFAAEQEKDSVSHRAANKEIKDTKNNKEIKDSDGQHSQEDSSSSASIGSGSGSLGDTSSGQTKRRPRPDKLELFGRTRSAREESTPASVSQELAGDSAHTNLYSRPAEKTALEICGEQMERAGQLSCEQRDSFIRNEQGIVRSHVLHYITQMVNMLIPLDINARHTADLQPAKSKATPSAAPRPVAPTADSPVNSEPTTPSHSQSFNDLDGSQNASLGPSHRRRSKNRASLLTNANDSMSQNNGQASHTKSNSDSDTDSGYDPTKQQLQRLPPSQVRVPTQPALIEYEVHEAGYQAWKFVSKFVEHVCMESELSDEQRQSLLNNLAEVISMQIQTLDTVHAESKRVPLRSKPRFDMLRPESLLPGERFVEPLPLRCHLVPDGRDELSGLQGSGTVLLPAEGKLRVAS